MKEKSRNIYPGGNTSKGFYSYYNYILPQKYAKKIFCLKGGPGTGKSTLMKNIGMYFLEKGEHVDFFKCSSDPESFDGVLLKDRDIAIVDGTAPHIIDPKNPGAVDNIIDLSVCWDKEKIRHNRRKIVACNDEISELFQFAYRYLSCAAEQYVFMKDVLNKIILPENLQEYNRRIQLIIDGISVIRRAENKVMKDSALGELPEIGTVKRFFAGAVTPMGIKTEISSIVRGIGKLIVLNVPVGFRSEVLLKPISERFVNAGFDVEEYYCPMDPEYKLEHIICEDADIAVISCNDYHNIENQHNSKKIYKLAIRTDNNSRGIYNELLKELQKDSSCNLLKAVELLKTAKSYHDKLEEYYISGMDFEKIEEITANIIMEINEEN